MGQTVLTNTVITKVNFRELPDVARLLVALRVAQYQFAFVHILGTAAANASWLVPRHSEVMPWVREGLEVGRRAGVRAMTEAIPFCFMTGYEDCVAEQIIPRTTVFDADVTLDDYTAYRRTEGKAKGPDCVRCVYFDRCEGPWAEYPQQFGWSELCPVEAPKKRGADDGGG
jgi:MoaA/NifB/PqqE/SkfB family radical SAM enzyme